jgi:DNA-binding winged helix-turn-helix (wHTH) protein/tetratricopeptide (TPR) repeat protein
MSDSSPLQARFGDFQIDEGNARLTRDGRPVELPPKAFAVLCALVRKPGQLVLKDDLLDAVWGHHHVSESVLKTIVSHLRSALADDARQPRYIETASRRGYRFIAAIGAPPAADERSNAAASALIGRDAPLALLHRHLESALRGQRQLVLVGGEAGIGKTSLIEGFAGALPPARCAVATGQCVEHYGAGEPYMPVLEALNMLCRAADGGALVGLMRRVAPTWLVQLPWYLGDEDRLRLQQEATGATQDRMLRELGELLDRATSERPLLLVLEDLHWSDHATVQLIGYLARRRTAASLMVLGSFRPTEIIVDEHPLAGLRQELRLHRLCREIDLEDFSEADVGELVAARLEGHRAPESFVRALHAHTEGLPLFVVNLLDELIAEGALPPAGGDWSFPDAAGQSVPASVVGVVEKQIARLAPAHQLVLGAGSVAGAEFGPAPLAEMLDLAPDALQRTLDDIVARQHWLRSVGTAPLPDGRTAARYAFRHVLYRHAFYQRLSPTQRTQWHLQAAAALLRAHGSSSSGDFAAELAMHFERAGEPILAVRQLAIVAGRALARSAAREALHAARHGVQLFIRCPQAWQEPEVELDLRVLEAVALSRLHVISEPEVAAAFERTRSLCERAGDCPARARALQGLWWVCFARGELPQARAAAQRMLDPAQGGRDPSLQLAGRSAMGVTLAMLGELPAAREHLEAALAIHEAIGDELPPGRFVQHPGVEAMGYLAVVSWWLGEPARARTLARDAVALAVRIRHPISQLIALHLSAALHHFAGEIQQALDATERIFGVIRDYDLPARPGAFSWLHGRAVAALDRVDDGLAEMQSAAQSCRDVGLRVGFSGFHLHYAEACRDAGRAAEAHRALDDGLAWAESAHEHYLLSPLHRVKGELLLRDGDAPGAEASLRLAIEIAQRQGARFHELTALVGAHRVPGLAIPGSQARLRAILDAYGDEIIPAVVEATALIAG